MIRTVLEVNARGPAVFQALVTKPHFGFTLVKADPIIQTVELQTGPSWFSWGETLKVTVVNLDAGSRLVVEGRRTVFHGILSDPAKASAKLISALAAKYGARATA